MRYCHDEQSLTRCIDRLDAEICLDKSLTWSENLRNSLLFGGVFNVLINISTGLIWGFNLVTLLFLAGSMTAVILGLLAYRSYRGKRKMMELSLLTMDD